MYRLFSFTRDSEPLQHSPYEFLKTSSSRESKYEILESSKRFQSILTTFMR